jgi:hypothetical protein
MAQVVEAFTRLLARGNSLIFYCYSGTDVWDKWPLSVADQALEFCHLETTRNTQPSDASFLPP